MNKKSNCVCNPDNSQMIKDVIEVLEREVSNYSKEYQPERVKRLQSYINTLKP